MRISPVLTQKSLLRSVRRIGVQSSVGPGTRSTFK
jgi:hypothetical protein